MAENYLQYYHLEPYLFDTVRKRFEKKGRLSAFDFFCILIWKANRAKTQHASRLLRYGVGDLDETVAALTRAVAHADDPKERLGVLMKDWGFRLPTASAILTVLYPKVFTVYDVRACESIGGFQALGNWTKPDRVWEGYVEFVAAVRAKGPKGRSLRDSDRYLWARSFAEGLRADIATGFAD
jgi:hypothetical protein